MLVWHVLNAQKDSPAETAGLDPDGAFKSNLGDDWVIGVEGRDMSKRDHFYEAVEQMEGKGLKLLVYSKKLDSLREVRHILRKVVIVPSKGWGGEGLIGCDVG